MTDEERPELRSDGGTEREPWSVGAATRIITPLKPSVEETVTETALSTAERVGAKRADVGPDR